MRTPLNLASSGFFIATFLTLTILPTSDLASKQLIRGRIEQQYPHHAIVGEEYGVTEHAGAEFRWFVDPIDGTKSFVRGVPLYGVLIGLEIAGKIEVGAVYLPALDEMDCRSVGCGLLVERPSPAGVGRDRPEPCDGLFHRSGQLRPLRPRSRVGAHPGRDLLPRRLDPTATVKRWSPPAASN